MPSRFRLISDEAEDDEASPWPLILSIAVAKIATLVVILVFAWGGSAMALIGATSLPWVVVIAGLLVAPLTWQIRMRRMRRRRSALQASEWMDVQPDVPITPEAKTASPGVNPH